MPTHHCIETPRVSDSRRHGLLRGALAMGLMLTGVAAWATPGDAFNMGAASVTVNENAGSVTVTVLRQGVGGGPASVDYSTSNFTATAPSDYTARSGTFNWNDGDLTPRTITIPIIDDAVVEGQEDFFVALQNPQGAGIGVLPSEAVIIQDNDVAAAAPTPVPAIGAVGSFVLGGLVAMAAAWRLRRRRTR